MSDWHKIAARVAALLGIAFGVTAQLLLLGVDAGWWSGE